MCFHEVLSKLFATSLARANEDRDVMSERMAGVPCPQSIT
jgi:hypothetical protein